MKTSDLEFEYHERADGYIYVNEDRLEEEIKTIITEDIDVETLEVPEQISREAYLCLTKKREHILKWYNFNKDASILEIGGGYGELTEYLCSHLGQVTCYERKAERIEIIKMRCKKYKNLNCCSGYLESQKWREKFDYILIHDIFALSRKFFKSDNADAEMLNFLLSYLHPEGKLLLMIENRLGLKYFAGAAEEYSTKFFWGLNSYDEDERRRTFSKGELNDILQRCNLPYVNWFYPYPSLEYPLEIYTDKIMDKIVYGISKPDYEIVADRYQYFDEQRMFYTLHKEGIGNKFVNAFFVECSMTITAKQIVFADLENDIYVMENEEHILLDQNGIVLPKGIRVDTYLAGKIQEAVNCNLGDKNPYILQIYGIWGQIYDFLLKGQYRMTDFYVDHEKVHLHKRNHVLQQPSTEYQRWNLVYTWYMDHIMFYRNAKRRILLEDLLEFLHISREKITVYIQKWEQQQEEHYFIPRLPQAMFDFEAEDAKDFKYFKKKDLQGKSLKSKLNNIWNIER